jgi:hypothetical protein
MEKPIPIKSAPGVKRDGTQFEGDNYVDAQWCRFQRGLPRKIGGYRTVTQTIPGVVRGMTSWSADGLQYIHMGGIDFLNQVQTDSQGVITAQNSRTPAALVNNPNNMWQLASFVDQVTGDPILLAHAGQNLAAIDNTVETSVFYGDMSGVGALASTFTDPVSGGVCALVPYALAYGNNGRIDIYDANFAQVNSAFVTGQKVVAGLPLRGQGGPAGIFWSLNSVIIATFTSATDGYFAFNEATAKSSVLSSQGIVEYDGIYYWAGVDRFLTFNGVIQELRNDFNKNWFYDNLNFTQRQKVFAFIVPRWGEIWWCYPRGNATECTDAVIYNVNEKVWYDTVLPTRGRSAAYFAEVYQRPFMVDTTISPVTSLYSLYQQETGVDEVYGNTVSAINSFFESSEISMLTQQNAINKSLRVARIEPDFVQSGDMTVQVWGRANARAPDVGGEIFTFPDTASLPEEETVKLKELRRLMRFRFGSNTAGGNYEMGQPMVHIGEGDGRIQS